MENTTAPSQRQKRSRDVSEDDEAGDTAGAASGSSRLAAGIDVVTEEKPETLFIQEAEEEEEAIMDMEETDRTPAHALREMDFFYVCPPDDDDDCGGGATAGPSCAAADQEPAVVDVALTLGCKAPLMARRQDTVDPTLRLGLSPLSATSDVSAAAALGANNDDLRLHLHGVPFSTSTGSKLDEPFWYTLPLIDESCRVPPPSPATPEEYPAASPEEEGGLVVIPDDAFNSFVPTGHAGLVVEFVTDDAIDRPSGSTVLDLNQPCSSPAEFPDDIAAARDDVDERPGRETAPEQRHQSSTP